MRIRHRLGEIGRACARIATLWFIHVQSTALSMHSCTTEVSYLAQIERDLSQRQVFRWINLKMCRRFDADLESKSITTDNLWLYSTKFLLAGVCSNLYVLLLS